MADHDGMRQPDGWSHPKPPTDTDWIKTEFIGTLPPKWMTNVLIAALAVFAMVMTVCAAGVAVRAVRWAWGI